MQGDLIFWKENLEREKERLKELLVFSKGVEHSATVDAKRNIKKYEDKIKEIESEIMRAIESEHETLETIEDAIDTAWNMVTDMKSNHGSTIDGYDALEEILSIENYLKAASKKARALKFVYEKELKK